jgi:hypothetical protein
MVEKPQDLRFTAHKCEIVEGGLRVTSVQGKTRDVLWSEMGRLVVRQFPPDPPWDAAVLLDLVALADGGTRWEPVRIFVTTFVNYGVLPGGSSTSRIENFRNLARLLREKNPALVLDPETTAFVDGQAPARFGNLAHFTDYDSHYQ